MELAEICREVGLPPGVLNVVTGLGTEAGAPLAAHPVVDKVQLVLIINTLVHSNLYGAIHCSISCKYCYYDVFEFAKLLCHCG